jgi:hypothetical protein
MGRFRNAVTGVVVSVDDAKDSRFADGWESADKSEPAPKATPKRVSSRKSEK